MNRIRLALIGAQLVRAVPLGLSSLISISDDPDVVREPEGQWILRAATSAILVLFGGVFAGLTIGLMGQDEIYLQVISETGTPDERQCAQRVLKLLGRGKHWVLVTLLLGNVITNETLPIVLDSILGGGWPAVVSSTAAIVIFGEIIPQSVCVRHGLSLGSFFAPFTLVLMYVMYPIAVPIAKLLDWALGEDHGTVYKKAGLKSLVGLHHTMGVERLNEDEVTIISGVLDLKDKPVSKIMTPIANVFVLSSETILNEEMVQRILLTGFNRIPIHVPGEPLNFIGMLLVRTLITYDPDDALPISSFALATLPETSPDTSCLNILNYFQEGKSHMVAVSTKPGDVQGSIGVVTLEDVIEELIGEEIVDESDVYVDVHKAIRRVTPAPMMRGTTLARLRPSNRANNPKTTANSKITIKSPPNAASSSLAAPNPEVMHSETAAIARNLATSPGISRSGSVKPPNLHGNGNGNRQAESTSSGKYSRGRRAPQPSSSSPIVRHSNHVITFTEEVVHVNGVNKVIIGEPPSPSPSGSSSD